MSETAWIRLIRACESNVATATRDSPLPPSSYSVRLNTQRRLFKKDGEATLQFLDFDESHGGFTPRSAKSLTGLQQVLNCTPPIREDPQCRFVIIHAPTSRDFIEISPTMLTYLLSYYHIMPIFVEYILPTVYLDKSFPPDPDIPDQAQDVYFSGLDEDHHLGHRHDLKAVEELGRSSRSIRLCYNLRSVERSKREPTSLDLHWSIKPMTMYHDFDVENGKALWITCKSSRELTRDLRNWVNSGEYPTTTTRGARFQATLRTHALFCKWAAGNWKWYLKELERQVQDIAESAQNADIDTYDGPGFPTQAAKSSPPQRSTDSAKKSSVSSGTQPSSPVPNQSSRNRPDLERSTNNSLSFDSTLRMARSTYHKVSARLPSNPFIKRPHPSSSANDLDPNPEGANSSATYFASIPLDEDPEMGRRRPHISSFDTTEEASASTQRAIPVRRGIGIPNIGTGIPRSSELASRNAVSSGKSMPAELPPGMTDGEAQPSQGTENLGGDNAPGVPPPTQMAEASAGVMPDNQSLELDPSTVVGAGATQGRSEKRRPSLEPPNVRDNEGTVLQLFPFKDVQKVQILGEKAQETLLVLQMNLDVLDELKSQYELVTSDPSFPQDLNRDCKASLIWFFKAIGKFENEFRKQMNRAESIQKSLEDRKNFLFYLIQYRNMQDNSYFARESRSAAQDMAKMTRNMEGMTNKMQTIANKTQQEAISMRIITLVTLFFLPATSIATFFGAGVVKMGEDDSWAVGRRKLGLFLGVSASLTLASFLAWWLMVRHHSNSKADAPGEAKEHTGQNSDQKSLK